MNYMLVVGGREQDSGTVSLRLRSGEDLGAQPVADFVARARDRVERRSRDL